VTKIDPNRKTFGHVNFLLRVKFNKPFAYKQLKHFQLVYYRRKPELRLLFYIFFPPPKIYKVREKYNKNPRIVGYLDINDGVGKSSSHQVNGTGGRLRLYGTKFSMEVAVHFQTIIHVGDQLC
jgi:hypothetical protein